MSLGFDLEKRNIWDRDHANDIFRFNLSLHHALLSGDSAIIRRFYQEGAGSLGCTDIYKYYEIERSFLYNARYKSAFVYAGLIPWIVESIVRLVASSGFIINSVLQNDGGGKFGDSLKEDLDNYINEVVKDIKLQELFERGVYLESGLGDFAYRISIDKSISDKPIIDVIEPQFLELEYKRGHINKVIIKESADDIVLGSGIYKNTVMIHEIYSKDNNGNVLINYKFYVKEKEITEENNFALYQSCKKYWNLNETTINLPFKEFPIIYKKNNKRSELYKQERGVPDIQGLESIEDALSECLSNLVDTIRKSAPKTFVDESLLPSDIIGDTLEYSDFDHTYLLLKNSGLDPTKMLVTIQATIDYQSHIETAKTLISHAINKAGLSPTTLGVTGLESINSAAESQDAREKPSLRTRKEKLEEWKNVLIEVLNKYFQYLAYVNGEVIGDYKNLFNITFNEYLNPSTENVVSVISQAVAGRIYSIELGVEKNFIHENKEYTLDDVVIESARIRGITPQQEMELLGLVQEVEQDDNDNIKNLSLENTEGDEPSVFHISEPTEALNEEEFKNGRESNE